MPLAQETVRSGSPQVLTATIANGGSLSDIQFVDGKLVGIIIPAAWTAAAITFQASMDGANFFEVSDGANTSTLTTRTIASANIPTTNGAYFPLSLNDWLSIGYVRLRSGTLASPVNQGAARAIGLVLAG